MASHVDTYEDEWAATLDDPERLAGSASFVNAPERPTLRSCGCPSAISSAPRPRRSGSAARRCSSPDPPSPYGGGRMTGRVTLVGGGPAPTDLLTVAATRALGEADVVLYDRLARRFEALAEHAPTAELVDVGKRPGHHAIPQPEIEALLVAHALPGDTPCG